MQPLKVIFVDEVIPIYELIKDLPIINKDSIEFDNYYSHDTKKTVIVCSFDKHSAIVHESFIPSLKPGRLNFFKMDNLIRLDGNISIKYYFYDYNKKIDNGNM